MKGWIRNVNVATKETSRNSFIDKKTESDPALLLVENLLLKMLMMNLQNLQIPNKVKMCLDSGGNKDLRVMKIKMKCNTAEKPTGGFGGADDGDY